MYGIDDVGHPNPQDDDYIITIEHEGMVSKVRVANEAVNGSDESLAYKVISQVASVVATQFVIDQYRMRPTVKQRFLNKRQKKD